MRLSPGDPAPDFSLPDDEEKPVTLMQFRGQRVVVYFYPAALTPGCTKQACDFRDNLRTLQNAGLAVVGISPHPPAQLREVREFEGLTFPLLFHPDHRVLGAFGAGGEKSLYVKTVTGGIRSTVVGD